jgi:predicted ATPase
MVDARCPVVVGRDAEIAVLRGVLAAAREGRGGLAVLTGMPGVGKSRLLTDLVGSARHDGWIVATGRAISGHAATPYRPLAEALLPMTRELDVRRVEGLGPWRAGLRAVFADPFEGKVQPRADPLVCGEAIVRLLRAVTAAGPVLVGLEDLHWADPDTLAVVEYLADHLAETAAACVVTVRSQPHSAAVDLIHILSARRNIAHVALAPLDDAAVVAMVRACRPAAAADTVGAVVASAEGIPFLVEELLSAPGLPPSFTSSVAARLGELTPAERDVIVAAAVVGRHFDWQLVADACGQDEDRVVAALAAARQRLLVDVDGGRFSFRHVLTRDAVLDGLLPPYHRRVARACLAALETIHPALPGAQRALAAALAEQAGMGERAAALLVELGADALRRGTLATAITTLREALSGTPDDTTRHVAQAELVEALARAGRTDECLSAGGQLLRETPAANITTRVYTHLALAEAAVEATRWTTVDSQLAAARSLLASAPDPAAQARWQVLTAETALAHRDLDSARRWAEDALAASAAVPEVRCHALAILGRSRRASNLDAARTVFEQALGVAEEAGLPLGGAARGLDVGCGGVRRSRRPRHRIRMLSTRIGARHDGHPPQRRPPPPGGLEYRPAPLGAARADGPGGARIESRSFARSSADDHHRRSRTRRLRTHGGTRRDLRRLPARHHRRSSRSGSREAADHRRRDSRPPPLQRRPSLACRGVHASPVIHSRHGTRASVIRATGLPADPGAR